MFDMEGEGNCCRYIPQHGIHLYISGTNIGEFLKVIGEYDICTLYLKCQGYFLDNVVDVCSHCWCWCFVNDHWKKLSCFYM
jgi:hypothetical protein